MIADIIFTVFIILGISLPILFVIFIIKLFFTDNSSNDISDSNKNYDRIYYNEHKKQSHENNQTKNRRIKKIRR